MRTIAALTSTGDRSLNRFNLNLFFALDAILDASSITEAARRVNLSQPAMSASLKKLREHFADELVVYQGGERQLTELAVALRPRIRAVLQSSREALDLSLQFDPTQDRREVRISAAYVLEVTFLARLIGNIVRAAPLIEVASVPFHYKPVNALLRENVDIAIVSAPFTQQGYPRQHIFTDTVSCLVWDGSAAFGDSLTADDYYHARHATMFDSPQSPDQLNTELHMLRRQRQMTVSVSHYSALPHMIIGTDLIVTTMTRFAKQCAETLPLRVLPVPETLPPIDFYAQWQPYRSDEPIIQWLLDQIRQTADEM